ncbi:MAG: hypothetical protein AAB518_00655 [Patescibacteria group bacterium]
MLHQHINYAKIYADFLGSTLQIKHPIRVVFDCSDGTVGTVLKELVSNHPLLVSRVVIVKPNGRFPAHGPNPLVGRAFENLGREVLEWKADIGVVFDGDGDRVFFVDDEGNRLSPDAAALLMSKNFRGSTIVDVRSGFMLRDGLRKDRKKIIDCRVGHFFIKKLMRKENVPFGAEISGHYYFKDFFYADSGLFAVICLINQLSRLKANGERLSGWVKHLPTVWASGELNFEISDKEGTMRTIEEAFKRRARVTSKLDGVRMEFGIGKHEWWFSVRPSNTENFLRLNLEARDEDIFKTHLKELKSLIGE